MEDQFLDWVVVVLPTLLSLVGVLVTLEPWDPKHKFKWRAFLVGSGIAVSTLTYWQQAHQRSKADTDARYFREQIIRQETDNQEKFSVLMASFNLFVAQTSRQPKARPAPRVPTPQEIASAVGEELKKMQPAPSGSPEQSPSAPRNVVPTPTAPPEQPAIVHPCRGEHLSECSDEQLLEWGKPLVASAEDIENDYMADLKRLDEIRGGSWNWLREVIGVGDKDSKWLKAYALAQQKAADRFRDCCAENALVYHRELAQRVGGGLENTESYEWVQDLMKQIGSKEHKKARQDAGKIIGVVYDLHSLQIRLHMAASKRQ